MIYLRLLVLFLSPLSLSSCATIFKGRTTLIHITVSEPSNVLIDHDTIARMQTAVVYRAERRKPGLALKVYNEEKRKDLYLAREWSLLTWANMLTPFSFLGVAADRVSGRGFTYPYTVYVDMDDAEKGYTRHYPMDDAKKNIVKFTPLKALGYVNPAVELSYERIFRENMSTQLKLGYLLPRGFGELYVDTPPHRRGYLISIEPRLYLKDKAPYGMYISIEGSHLKSDYSTVETFHVPNADGSYDAEGGETYIDSIGVHKRNSAISLKIGGSYVYKRWIVDIYAGLGAFRQHVWHTDRLHPGHTTVSPRHPNVWHISQTEQKRWTVGVPVNLSVGYRF